jgi:hypothetical protein
MKILLRNTITGLVPIFPSDFDEKKTLKLGADYEAEIRLTRNVRFHRKMFALFNVGHQNTDLDLPFESYRRYMTMKAGYFKAYQTPKGVYYEADSLSFSSMSQETFEEVYSRVLDKIIEDIGATSEEIERSLIDFM